MNKREQYLLERLQITEQTLVLILENIEYLTPNSATLEHIKSQMLVKLHKLEKRRKVEL